MDFLRRHAVKFAFIAIIVFFALPFIYGNEEEDGFSPFAVRSGLSYQANPISRLADRIASFYGFSRNRDGGLASKTDVIKDKVSKHLFAKENEAKENSVNGTLMASAKKANSDDKISNNSNTNSAANSYQAGSQNSSNPFKGTVNINGKDYKVIEDIKGEKYLVTPKGHVPYKDVLRKSFSEQEFLAAKKRMPNASDFEVLETLQQEKAKQISNGSSAVNTQNYQTNSYRTGTAGTMGGNSSVRVSYGDKGIDHNALSDAYGNLQNINVNIDTPKSSSGGGYLSGGYASSGSKNVTPEENAQANLTQDIAKNARATITDGMNNKMPETNLAEILGTDNFPITMKEGGKIETDNKIKVDKSAFLVTGDSLADYKEWFTNVKSITYQDGNNETNYQVKGAILPTLLDEAGELKPEVVEFIKDKKEQQKMQDNIEKMNSSIATIKDNLGSFQGTIYIDENNMDEPSKQWLKSIKGMFEGIIVQKPQDDIVSVSGPIYTPSSFQQFADKLTEITQNLPEAEQPQA